MLVQRGQVKYDLWTLDETAVLSKSLDIVMMVFITHSSWLEMEKFDVALVDLVVNECGLALAYHLGVPVVGYWAFALSRNVFDSLFSTVSNEMVK